MQLSLFPLLLLLLISPLIHLLTQPVSLIA